jgi:hypothetical protein
MTPTQILLVATVVIWVAYDVFAAIRWGAMQTISVVLWQLAQKYPVIPLAVGALIGHLWIPMIGLNCGK